MVTKYVVITEKADKSRVELTDVPAALVKVLVANLKVGDALKVSPMRAAEPELPLEIKEKGK